MREHGAPAVRGHRRLDRRFAVHRRGLEVVAPRERHRGANPTARAVGADAVEAREHRGGAVVRAQERAHRLRDASREHAKHHVDDAAQRVAVLNAQVVGVVEHGRVHQLERARCEVAAAEGVGVEEHHARCVSEHAPQFGDRTADDLRAGAGALDHLRVAALRELPQLAGGLLRGGVAVAGATREAGDHAVEPREALLGGACGAALRCGHARVAVDADLHELRFAVVERVAVELRELHVERLDLVFEALDERVAVDLVARGRRFGVVAHPHDGAALDGDARVVAPLRRRALDDVDGRVRSVFGRGDLATVQTPALRVVARRLVFDAQRLDGAIGAEHGRAPLRRHDLQRRLALDEPDDDARGAALEALGEHLAHSLRQRERACDLVDERLERVALGGRERRAVAFGLDLEPRETAVAEHERREALHSRARELRLNDRRALAQRYVGAPEARARVVLRAAVPLFEAVDAPVAGALAHARELGVEAREVLLSGGREHQKS